MSLSLRFNTVTTGVKEHMLKYFTNVDYDSHFAVSALVKDTLVPAADAALVTKDQTGVDRSGKQMGACVR